MASEYVEALPEAREDLAGESIEKGKSNRYAIKVSNARGYLCHIKMEVTCSQAHVKHMTSVTT